MSAPDFRAEMRTNYVLGCITGFMFCAAVVAIFWSPLCRAADWSLDVHGASHHFGKRADGSRFNERNIGIGGEYEASRELGFGTGAYRNSIDRTSAYVLTRWTPLEIAGWRGGAVGGFVTGYDYNGGGPVPMAALAVITPEWQRMSVQVIGVPGGIHPKLTGFVAASLRVRF